MATPPRVSMLSGRGSELGILRSQLRLQFGSTSISPNFQGQHRKITSLKYYFSCRSEQIRDCPSDVQAPKSGNWFWADCSCVHSWLGGVLHQGFGRWTRIQSDVFKSHSYILTWLGVYLFQMKFHQIWYTRNRSTLCPLSLELLSACNTLSWWHWAVIQTIHSFISPQCPFRKAKGLVQRVLFHPTKPFLFVAVSS